MKTSVSPKNRLKLIEIALLIGLAVFLASGGLALRAQSQLAERVVRLHVLANSDGQEDQALKLLVRDRVLARATELLTQARDRTEAEALLRAELPELEALAVRELRANGCAYPVTAELADTEFPTRVHPARRRVPGPAGGDRRGRGAELVVRGVPAPLHCRLRRRPCRCPGGGSHGGSGGPDHGGGPGLRPQVQGRGVVGGAPGAAGERRQLKSRLRRR